MNGKITAVLNRLNDSFNGIRINSQDENEASADIRYWGNWEFPQDQHCEDGEDEDCDYEELTDHSYSLLMNKIDTIRKDFPSVDIQVQCGEKNYIDFDLKVKDK